MLEPTAAPLVPMSTRSIATMIFFFFTQQTHSRKKENYIFADDTSNLFIISR